MPKQTPEQRTVEALKRLPFNELESLCRFFFDESEAASSSQPPTPEVVAEFTGKWNLTRSAINEKYQDLVKRANQPPPTIEVH